MLLVTITPALYKFITTTSIFKRCKNVLNSEMADNVEIELDTSEIVEALTFVERNSKKDALQVVNQAAIGACIGGGQRKKGTFYEGALQKTKTASKATIGKFDPDKDAKSALTKKRTRLFHALATKGSAKKGQGNANLARKIYSGRQSARGYGKGIWLKIAKDLGARVRTYADTNIAHGKKATIRTLAAFVEIEKTDGWSDDMRNAYKKGLANSARDMVRHVEEKLNVRFKQVEPK